MKGKLMKRASLECEDSSLRSVRKQKKTIGSTVTLRSEWGLTESSSPAENGSKSAGVFAPPSRLFMTGWIFAGCKRPTTRPEKGNK